MCSCSPRYGKDALGGCSVDKCSNLMLDDGETDIDCGGFCNGCKQGFMCEHERSCAEGLVCFAGDETGESRCTVPIRAYGVYVDSEVDLPGLPPSLVDDTLLGAIVASIIGTEAGQGIEGAEDVLISEVIPMVSEDDATIMGTTLVLSVQFGPEVEPEEGSARVAAFFAAAADAASGEDDDSLVMDSPGDPLNVTALTNTTGVSNTTSESSDDVSFPAFRPNFIGAINAVLPQGYIIESFSGAQRVDNPSDVTLVEDTGEGGDGASICASGACVAAPSPSPTPTSVVLDDPTADDLFGGVFDDDTGDVDGSSGSQSSTSVIVIVAVSAAVVVVGAYFTTRMLRGRSSAPSSSGQRSAGRNSGRMSSRRKTDRISELLHRISEAQSRQQGQPGPQSPGGFLGGQRFQDNPAVFRPSTVGGGRYRNSPRFQGPNEHGLGPATPGVYHNPGFAAIPTPQNPMNVNAVDVRPVAPASHFSGQQSAAVDRSLQGRTLPGY